MYVTINETNYNKAIKSVADYYNNNPLNYQITLTIQSGLNSKQIVTVIPKVDYKSSSFTLEEYLKQNFDYLLERNGNKILINFDITKAVETSKSKNIILFTDDKENFECFSKSDVRYIRI
uniref:PIN domain-containing protein n=1 Tax=Panagrolaimus davidi TaxID=227884 RepID=A0A914QTP0_9BILA